MYELQTCLFHSGIDFDKDYNSLIVYHNNIFMEIDYVDSINKYLINTDDYQNYCSTVEECLEFINQL